MGSGIDAVTTPSSTWQGRGVGLLLLLPELRTALRAPPLAPTLPDGHGRAGARAGERGRAGTALEGTLARDLR